METKSNIQEIDLLELLARFYGYLRKNWVLTVLLPLIGAALGLTLYWLTPNQFESKLLLVSEVLTETECNYLIRQLEEADSENPLATEQFKGKVNLVHGIRGTSHIEIIIRVQDRSLQDPVQKIILNFMEGNETARSRVADSIQYYTQMIAEIDREIQSIEEAKSQFDSKVKTTFPNPSDLFTTSLELRERKVKLQIKRNDTRTFRVVQGANAMSRQVEKPPTDVAIGFIGGCAVLMIVLFVKFFLSYYREYNQTATA